MCHLHILISEMFLPVAHVLIGLLIVLPWSFESSLRNLGTTLMLDVRFTNIFAYSIVYFSFS